LIPVGAAVAALIVTISGSAFGARAAGGADTSGYVSQAKLWLRGDLRVTRSELREVPWPNGEWTLTPLGYKPAGPQTIVPIYSPGLPLLMAGAELVLGPCGPFLVTPICAGWLVWLTYVLGTRLSRKQTGVLAALCIATSPTVSMMTLTPMSDVPAATFWTASLVLACSPRLRAAAASGVVAGIAVLIRPNLAPLALFPLLISLWPFLRAWSGASGSDKRAAAVGRAAMFVVGCAPAIVFVGWLFNDLYGSPFESGYGSASGIYAWRHAPINVIRYPGWLWETQGPAPFLCLLAPWLSRRRQDARTGIRWLVLGFGVAVFGGYVLYEPFDAWWYLRFLLPAFPVLFVLAFDAIGRFREPGRPAVVRTGAVLLTIVALYQGTAYTLERDIIRGAEGEQKYADAGRFANNLPAGSVVLAMQHSGSVRLYSGRLALRYDLLAPEWLDAALDYLRQQGHEPYLMLEPWEVEIFRTRFDGQRSARSVESPPLAVLPRGDVLLFSASPSPGRLTTAMPPTHGCETVW
jgi:hypothetical protein